MSFPNSTNNPQPLLTGARCLTDGAGGIITRIPQQNVGDPSWSFDGVDPTSGQIRLSLAQRLATTVDGTLIGIYLAGAVQSGDGGPSPVLARVQQSSDTTLLITVGEAGVEIDLTTNAVDITVIGLVPL